jgi:hypothetical protein
MYWYLSGDRLTPGSEVTAAALYLVIAILKIVEEVVC